MAKASQPDELDYTGEKTNRTCCVLSAPYKTILLLMSSCSLLSPQTFLSASTLLRRKDETYQNIDL